MNFDEKYHAGMGAGFGFLAERMLGEVIHQHPLKALLTRDELEKLKEAKTILSTAYDRAYKEAAETHVQHSGPEGTITVTRAEARFRLRNVPLLEEERLQILEELFTDE